MHPCPKCGSCYTSMRAAEECGEADRLEELHAHQALRGRTRTRG